MIHYNHEGMAFKLGLNFRFAKGGFLVVWAWYNFATHEATTKRFRLRLHKAPRILWRVDRFNVVGEYMRARDLEMIGREELADLREAEQGLIRRNAAFAYIKT